MATGMRGVGAVRPSVTILLVVTLGLWAVRPATAVADPGVPGPPGATVDAAGTDALDIETLETRLRETRAIGLFTKLSLRNQVSDLLEDFRRFHQGPGGGPLERLHQRFDLLLMKVLSLLQDDDPALARDIAASRDALLQRLADPRTFANRPT